MRPHNYVEEEVFKATDAMADADAEFCGCEKCRADVAAITLCQLPPIYATSEAGAIAAAERFSDPVLHATVLTTVNGAIAAVKAHPRH